MPHRLHGHHPGVGVNPACASQRRFEALQSLGAADFTPSGGDGRPQQGPKSRGMAQGTPRVPTTLSLRFPGVQTQAPAPQELPRAHLTPLWLRLLHPPVMAGAPPAALATAPLGRGTLLVPPRRLQDPSHNNFGEIKAFSSSGGPRRARLPWDGARGVMPTGDGPHWLLPTADGPHSHQPTPGSPWDPPDPPDPHPSPVRPPRPLSRPPTWVNPALGPPPPLGWFSPTWRPPPPRNGSSPPTRTLSSFAPPPPAMVQPSPPRPRRGGTVQAPPARSLTC